MMMPMLSDPVSVEKFLVDVLGAESVRVRGDELVHSCLLPFGLHRNGDRNPSASLNVSKLVYGCFVCGGGSLLWATQVILDVSAIDAQRIIQQHLTADSISKERFLSQLEELWLDRDSGIPVMPEYSLKIVEKWMCYSKYLDDRGISRDVQREMMTGVDLNHVDKIGGVFITQPRLVIPHIFGGKLVGWTMRKLSDRQLGPKYVHTSSFPRNYTLYNWDGVRSGGFRGVIVVESPMSVLRLKTCGIHNSVATFGAQVSDKQIELLSWFEEITIFPDGDDAGYGALVGRGKRLGLLDRLMPIASVFVVDHAVDRSSDKPRFNGKDPADYTCDQLNELLANRVAAIQWRWPEGIERAGASSKKPKRLIGSNQPRSFILDGNEIR